MQKWVVANWKMNGSSTLVNAYRAALSSAEKLIVCPPFVYLNQFGLPFGAQNVHHQANGAYTGEISASMLAEIGANYCLVGHSERRQFFNETNQVIKLKATSCLQAGITPIICIGETLEEHASGQTSQVLAQQLAICLPEVPGFWLAYEPLWAIGTGKTPTLAEIAKVHASLGKHFPDIVLLYGGSVNPTNAAEILTVTNVDGVLVGGASLDIPAITAIYKGAFI